VTRDDKTFKGLRKIKAGTYNFEISISGLGLADASGVSGITINP